MTVKKFSTVFLVLIAGLFFVQPADARGLDLNRIDIIIGLGRHAPRHHFHHEPPPSPPPHAHHRHHGHHGRPPRGHYAHEHREEFERRGPDGRVVERITRIETHGRPYGHERHQRHHRRH